MGFRFRKSFKIAPGVRVNVGKKSIGISAGVKGARVSVNSSGRKTTTVGIPGTGLSYQKTEKIGGAKKAQTGGFDDLPETDGVEPANLPPIVPPPQKPQKPASKATIAIMRILAVALIGMGLTLTLVTVVGGLAATALGCVLMHKSRWHDAERTGKPYKQAKRCRWQYVVAALFVFFAIGGKAADTPADDTAEQQAIAEQQAAQEQAEKEAAEKAAAEKAAKEQTEKEAAEKAAAEKAAKEQAEKEAAEKAAAEQAEKEAAEKAAAEQAAKEQAEKEAAEKAAAEQAAAAAAAQAAQEQAAAQQQGETVYITPSGKRWHRSANCAGKNARAVTMDQVGNRTPCKKCA